MKPNMYDTDVEQIKKIILNWGVREEQLEQRLASQLNMFELMRWDRFDIAMIIIFMVSCHSLKQARRDELFSAIIRFVPRTSKRCF